MSSKKSNNPMEYKVIDMDTNKVKYFRKFESAQKYLDEMAVDGDFYELIGCIKNSVIEYRNSPHETNSIPEMSGDEITETSSSEQEDIFEQVIDTDDTEEEEEEKDNDTKVNVIINENSKANQPKENWLKKLFHKKK